MKSQPARYAPLALLAIAAFLAPIMGGQLLMDLQALTPGPLSVFPALFGPEAALISHAVVAAFMVAAIGVAVFRYKVLQLPSAKLLGLWTILATLLLLSLLNTSYRAVSLAVTAEWLLCMGAFVAAVSISGHDLGPKALLGAVVAGCTAVALYAIREYMGAGDPHWRVFGTWINANALAGMLAFGFFAALGLAGATKDSTSLMAGVCATVVGVAMLMAQSRGATVAVAAGLIVFLVATVLGGGGVRDKLSVLGKSALCLVAAFLLFLAMFNVASKRANPSGGASTSAFSRVSGPTDQAKEQSSGFRKMLWKGALQQVAQNPVGVGMGAYRFEGTRAGLTPQTQFAHQSYLQLAVEASPLASICLILLLLFWFGDALKGHRSMPGGSSPLRSAVLAAVTASCAHSMFDSDLYNFGIGFTLFLFLGIGLQIAADGLSPEVVPGSLRKAATVCAALLVALLGYMGWARLKASQAMGGYALARAYAAQGDRSQAQEALESAEEDVKTAVAALPFDGELYYQKAFFARTREERLDALRQAAALTPMPKYYRALAREHLAAKDSLLAVADLQKALAIDPNNLSALSMMVDAFRATGELDKAAETARRMIDVEAKPYFQVRALPEVVPTETYSAREFLAGLTTDPGRKLDLLKPALSGRLDYLHLTYPRVIAAVKGGREHYAGETLDDAREKLGKGRETAEKVAELYRAAGRPEDAEGAEAASREFADALGTD